MILDGVSYAAFLQYCRVILSRMVEPHCVFIFKDKYFCLWASIDAPVFIQ